MAAFTLLVNSSDNPALQSAATVQGINDLQSLLEVCVGAPWSTAVVPLGGSVKRVMA